MRLSNQEIDFLLNELSISTLMNENENGFKVDELVHYRNEKNPNKIYRILSVSPSFITIADNENPNIKEVITIEDSKSYLYPIISKTVGGRGGGRGGGGEFFTNANPYNKIPASFYGGIADTQGWGSPLHMPNQIYPYSYPMSGGNVFENLNITPVINMNGGGEVTVGSSGGGGGGGNGGGGGSSSGGGSLGFAASGSNGGVLPLKTSSLIKGGSNMESQSINNTFMGNSNGGNITVKKLE